MHRNNGLIWPLANLISQATLEATTGGKYLIKKLCNAHSVKVYSKIGEGEAEMVMVIGTPPENRETPFGALTFLGSK